jgi:heme/copper-type cytochrome/quinol oxidase subunit 2
MHYLKKGENLIKISYGLELLIIPLWIVLHYINTTNLLIPFWIVMFLFSIIAVTFSLKAKKTGKVNYKWSYRIGIILTIFTALGIIVNTYFEFFFNWVS